MTPFAWYVVEGAVGAGALALGYVAWRGAAPVDTRTPEQRQADVARKVAVDLYRAYVKVTDEGGNAGEALRKHVNNAAFDLSPWLAVGVAEYGTLTALVQAAGFAATPEELARATAFLAVTSAIGVMDIGLYDQAVRTKMLRGGQDA